MKMRKRYKKFKSRNKGKSFNSNSKTKKLACFEYGSTEHLVKECPKMKKRNTTKKTKRNKQ